MWGKCAEIANEKLSKPICGDPRNPREIDHGEKIDKRRE